MRPVVRVITTDGIVKLFLGWVKKGKPAEFPLSVARSRIRGCGATNPNVSTQKVGTREVPCCRGDLSRLDRQMGVLDHRYSIAGNGY